jgi:hypothetical protein
MILKSGTKLQMDTLWRTRPTAVVLNDSSSPRDAFTAMDGLGLPAAPVPSGGRTRGNCPLCGKGMRLDTIEGHKNKRNCVQRQKKNLENN